MKNEFYITRQLFADYIGYTGPVDFETWDNFPQDQKSAVLYLQFFDQITLAWEKTKSSYSSDEDGVSEVLKYLEKNVSKIHEDPNRFTPNYIYTVAYNCLFCLCRDPNRFKRVYENETSNIQMSGDEEYDLCDTESSLIGNPESILDNTIDKARFWSLIENLDIDTQIVVEILLGNKDTMPLKLSSLESAESYQDRLHRGWSGEVVKHSARKVSQFTPSKVASIDDAKIQECMSVLQDALSDYRFIIG